MRIRIILTAAALVTALAVAGSATGRPSATKLKGTVGPNYTITLKNSSGKKVTTLKHGMYTIVVSDKSSFHSFVLEGPGVEVVGLLDPLDAGLGRRGGLRPWHGLRLSGPVLPVVVGSGSGRRGRWRG